MCRTLDFFLWFAGCPQLCGANELLQYMQFAWNVQHFEVKICTVHRICIMLFASNPIDIVLKKNILIPISSSIFEPASLIAHCLGKFVGAWSLVAVGVVVAAGTCRATGIYGFHSFLRFLLLVLPLLSYVWHSLSCRSGPGCYILFVLFHVTLLFAK